MVEMTDRAAHYIALAREALADAQERERYAETVRRADVHELVRRHVPGYEDLYGDAQPSEDERGEVRADEG